MQPPMQTRVALIHSSSLPSAPIESAQLVDPILVGLLDWLLKPHGFDREGQRWWISPSIKASLFMPTELSHRSKSSSIS